MTVSSENKYYIVTRTVVSNPSKPTIIFSPLRESTESATNSESLVLTGMSLRIVSAGFVSADLHPINTVPDPDDSVVVVRITSTTEPRLHFH